MKTHIARTTACRAEARASARGERRGGFSIVEMLIATVIMMAVTGATFALMNPAQGMFVAQPEVSDMQQRLRIAVDTLQKDLLMAGAGTYSGNNKLGSLGQYVATILPDREGNITPDPPGTFKCTTTFCSSLGASDTITLMYVPPTSAQTTIRDAMPAELGGVEGQRAAGMSQQRRLVRVQRRHAGDDLRRLRRQRHLLDHQRADIGAPPAAQGPGSFEVVRGRTRTSRRLPRRPTGSRPTPSPRPIS